MGSSESLSPELFNELRGLAFSNKCECLRRLINLVQTIMCDLEYLDFEIDELKEQKGVKK